MIQDIAPQVFHNEYEPAVPQDGDTVFAFEGKKVLVEKNAEGGFCFPRAEDLHSRKGELRYLFRIDDDMFFLYLPEAADDPVLRDLKESRDHSFEAVPLMEIRRNAEVKDMFACMTAFHLFTWYDRSRYCGRCGAPLVHGEKERVLRCPDCGNTVFPVIAPAVIVAVTSGESLLMTKYAGRAYTGWALIAGFCEIGETFEDTVRREVMEEAGIRVKNLRYVASQPWGVDSNLLFGVFCEVDGDTSVHIDTEELSRAVWIKREEVPCMMDNHSLTGHMIEMFRTGKI